MYRIIKIDGTELGITDSVNFIKISSSGSFSSTSESNAIGVALNGVAYNLVGHNAIDGADTVVVSSIDGGEILRDMASYTELAAAIREGVNAV